MDTEIIRIARDALDAALANLERREASASARIVSKMSKNTRPGDEIEIDGRGFFELTGWGINRRTHVVTITAPGLGILNLPGDQRVRVRRATND